MKLSTRELVIIAVFGTLWGVVEMSLGTVLKSLNVPMNGVVLGAIGLTIAIIGRVFVPRRGSTFFIGVIATLLKLFSLGGVIIGPMIGIMSEAIVAEIVLSLGGKPRQSLFIAAGAAGILTPLVQPFVTGPLLFGQTLYIVWLNMLNTGERLLGIDTSAVFAIVAALIVIHLAIGATAGFLGWRIGQQLQTRMGRDVSVA